jgi:tRNA G10  N-methylase Trm11
MIGEPRNLSLETVQQFLFTFAFGAASQLELVSTLELLELGSVESLDQNAAIISCTERNARSIISRVGGVNRVSRVLSRDLQDAISQVLLPDRDKFSWSIASYGCGGDLALQARQELRDALKREGLGKSKFLEPIDRSRSESDAPNWEIDAADLESKIIATDEAPRGIEFVLYCSRNSKPIFAETIDSCDVASYRKRDLGRPHGDPTRTLSPRLSRLLVNLSLSSRDLRLLDPFCGLGTVLGEALMCGCDVVGTDRNSRMVSDARENLGWIAQQFSIRGRSIRLFAYDARRISRASFPSVGAIASEPILLPIYKRNPSSQEAIVDLDRARETYSRCFAEFATLLENKGNRLALIVPSVVDSAGRERKLAVEGFAEATGFRLYHPKKQTVPLNYPMKLVTAKKRMVLRNLVIYETT